MGKADPILVGIDIGTTNVKAVSVDVGGRVLTVHHRPMVIHRPMPGATEFGLNELSSALIELLTDTVAELEAAGQGPSRIAVISVAGVGESYVGLDSDDRPALPCPTWYDRRTAPFRSENGLSAESWFNTTGMVDDDIYTIWRLIWWQRRDPDAFARVLRWFSMPDYALFLLGGVHAAHPGSAARTGMADRHRLDWSDDHLAIAGIARDAMPRLMPQASVAGGLLAEVAASTGLPRDVALVNAGHDHPCAGFGSGMTAPGSFVNSAGTSESLICLLPGPLDYNEVGGGEYDCYPHAAPGHFLLSGHIPSSGAVIDWVAARLNASEDAAAAEVPPGARGVRVAPYLQGSGSPWNQRGARMRIAGIEAGTGDGELLRATYEGLSAWLSISVARFVAQTGYDPSEILLTGGGSRHRTYSRIKAAMLDRTLVAADIPEAAGIGAALVGGLAIGLWSTTEDAVLQGATAPRRFEPDQKLRKAYASLRSDLQDFVTP